MVLVVSNEPLMCTCNKANVKKKKIYIFKHVLDVKQQKKVKQRVSAVHTVYIFACQQKSCLHITGQNTHKYI